MLRSLEVNLSVAILQKVLFDCIFTMVLHCRLILQIAIRPHGTLPLVARLLYGIIMFMIQSLSERIYNIRFFNQMNQIQIQVINSLKSKSNFFFWGGGAHTKNLRNCLHCPHSTPLHPTAPSLHPLFLNSPPFSLLCTPLCFSL